MMSRLFIIFFILSICCRPSFGGFFRRSSPKDNEDGHDIFVDGGGAVFTHDGDGSVNIVMTQSSGSHTFQSGEPGERLIAQETNHGGRQGSGPVVFISPPPNVSTTKRSNSPTSSVTDFIRRHTPRIFRRRPASEKPPQPELDPSKMSVPELFAALSSLPPSKFDKIADQLIAESFGISSFANPPSGALGALLSGGLGSGSSGGGLLPSLPSLSSLSSLASNPLPSIKFPSLPSLNSFLPSVVSGQSSNGQSSSGSSSSNVQKPSPPTVQPEKTPNTVPMMATQPQQIQLSQMPHPLLFSASMPSALTALPASSSPITFKTVVFPVYVPSQSQHMPSRSPSTASSNGPNLLSLNSWGSSSSQMEPSMETINQIIAAAAIASSENSGRSSSRPNSMQPSPIIHGSNHPLDTFNSILNNGYINDINSLQQPFTFDESRTGPRQGLPSTTTSTTTERPFRSQWHFGQPSAQIPVFSPVDPTTPNYNHHSSYHNQPTHPSRVMQSDPPGTQRSTIPPSIPIASSVPEVEKIVTKYPLQKTYPILDTSSSEVKIFHAPHNPVDILKIFANAYEKTQSSQLPQPESLIGSGPGALGGPSLIDQKVESRVSTGAESAPAMDVMVPILNPNSIIDATTPAPLQVTILKKK